MVHQDYDGHALNLAGLYVGFKESLRVSVPGLRLSELAQRSPPHIGMRGEDLRMKLSIVALALVTSAAAAETPTQFWNLTSSTVVSLRLSHAGTGEYGDNVAAGDADGVAHDKRVDIPDLPTGRYDMELKFKRGRTCAVTAGRAFAVEDSDLVACTKK
jgi:hypothetical protein